MYTTFQRLLLISLLDLCYLSTTSAQKQLAITIDDPNTYTTPLLTWQQRNNALLRTLAKRQLQAALFVCGKRVDSPAGSQLLEAWDQQQHLIANHSYDHLYYHSNGVSSEAYVADFRKGDERIQSYKQYTKLFRYPYLKEGNTLEKRDAMRRALALLGYKNGSVTIDASDWYLDQEITRLLEEDNEADLIPYKAYYIQHILERAAYYEELAQAVFHRNIKHTLLLHHSLLNALFLEDLLKALEGEGWTLINAAAAYEDPVVALQADVLPCGESLVWQHAKLDAVLAPTLRYPAENSQYEKKPLEDFLATYKEKHQK